MRAIVFDLDGTLLEFPRPYGEILREAVAAVVREPDPDALAAYHEEFADRFGACEPDPVRNAFDAAGFDADPDRLADSLLEREAAASRPPAGAREDLRRLGEAYALGVCTNGVRAWQLHKLRANGLEEHVDAVVASYEVGAHKPAREPFAALEERLPADAYAMVGDSDGDVRGAREAGWTAHRYDGGGFDALPGALDWE